MPTVDDLFDRFRADYRSGTDADPRSYLDQLSGDDRRELRALIDGFLAHAPPDPVDAAALARAQASPLRAALQAAVDAQMATAETWEQVLVEARHRAELPRERLVARLADALGVAGRRDKVARYYHQMESGLLPPTGVSDRVLEALSTIIGVPVERLRAAGRALRPDPGAGAGPVFARTAAPAAGAAAPAAPASPGTAPEDEWDEVDELFRGGAA
jgi:hypothetical protein